MNPLEPDKDRLSRIRHHRDQGQDQILARAWEAARAAFRAHAALAPAERSRHDGRLLELLAPWIQDAIRTVERRYFLLFPEQSALARLFGALVELDALPDASASLHLWVESHVLRDFGSFTAALPDSGEEAAAQLARHFNALAFRERALLWSWLVERRRPAAVAADAGLEPAAAEARLRDLWHRVSGGRPLVSPGWPPRSEPPPHPAVPSQAED